MSNILPLPVDKPPAKREEPAQVETLSRDEFLSKFGDDYGDGQHVTTIGPTQRGKTTLVHQMLSRVASKDRKVVVFAGKPPRRDPVMNSAAKNLNLRVVTEWPPDPWEKFRARKKNGYVLRPEHDMADPEKTDKHLQRVFKTGLVDNYKSHEKRIVVVDEAAHVSKELALQRYMDTILMRGAPDVSLWVIAQRGRHLSYMIYDQPEWFILGYDPDRSNVRRYSEIGGVDPKQVFDLQTNLKTHPVTSGGTISEFLVIRRSGPEIFIVDVQ